MRAVAATITGLLLVAANAQAARATEPLRRAPRQELVTLRQAHSVRLTPSGHDAPVAYVSARRPITAERTTLPVLGQIHDGQGRSWLRVRLPGRSLGREPPPPTGWILASDTLTSTTPWKIVVDVDARAVRAYHQGRLRRRFTAIVGKRSTPTPAGHYFVEENVRLPAERAGAPFALATSARSPVLQEFDGGPGQIALHGLGNLGGELGTAVSHGCVRLGDDAITWLAARMAPGVPITVV